MARVTDLAIARLRFGLFPGTPALIVLNFHATVRYFDELRDNVICPQFCVTLEQVRRCIEYFVTHGYIAISPDEIVLGLRDDRNYVMFTFDDGYFNNSQVVSLLEAAGVPALFAIATDYISSGKSFWWDVLYRERLKAGGTLEDIRAESHSLLPKCPQTIEQHLISEFGEESLNPVGDTDRPFSPSELRLFAANKHVFIANHTAAHEWLPCRSASDLESTLSRAQEYLEEVTGQRPVAVVYPFGDASEQVINIAKHLGLRVGFTTRLAKQPLPLESVNNDHMRLPRFTIGPENPALQCELARFDWRLSSQIKVRFHSLLNPKIVG